MSEILKEDFENIIERSIDWEKLRAGTILVTGATGFIGSLIIRTLDYISKKRGLSINLLAFVRNEQKAKEILEHCDVTIILGDIRSMPEIVPNIDYIFHCAAITKSKEMIENPVQVIEGIVNGTQNLLKLAQQKNIKSMVYLSSMEVYGRTDSNLEYVREDDLGHVEIRNARNSYPIGKRMAENICFSYYSQYNVPVKIARLAQTFGAGVLKNENRVFSQFATSAIKQENIILHTDGSSSANCCYSADAVAALLLLLLEGADGEIYNISNEAACATICEMAEIVAKRISNGTISVIFDIPKGNIFGYASPVKMKLSSEKIRKLGWQPQYGIEDMYRRMITYMQEEMAKGILFSKKIIIYGAQVIAFGIYIALKELSDVEILCFAVSNADGNPKEIDAIPVIEISKLYEEYKDTLVLVATPEPYQSEIRTVLTNYGFSNYICIDSHMEYEIMSQYYRKNKRFRLLEDCVLERGIKTLQSLESMPELKVLMAKWYGDKKLSGEYILDKWVVPIQVGAELTEKKVLEITDNTGENISAKNRNYSELTATYWAWKNINTEYKGICHYRRIFLISDTELCAMKHDNIDVVLPLPFICNPDASGQYRRYISDSDLELVYLALEEMHMDYFEDFKMQFKLPYLYNYNMLIARSEVFDDYCAWMFPVLDRIEELSEIKNGSRSDRYIGYIGEILTSLYFLHNMNDLKIVHAEKKWLI